VKASLAQRTVAECLGTAFLLAAVVGSGIMAARLAGGRGVTRGHWAAAASQWVSRVAAK